MLVDVTLVIGDINGGDGGLVEDGSCDSLLFFVALSGVGFEQPSGRGSESVEVAALLVGAVVIGELIGCKQGYGIGLGLESAE